MQFKDNFPPGEKNRVCFVMILVVNVLMYTKGVWFTLFPYREKTFHYTMPGFFVNFYYILYIFATRHRVFHFNSRNTDLWLQFPSFLPLVFYFFICLLRWLNSPSPFFIKVNKKSNMQYLIQQMKPILAHGLIFGFVFSIWDLNICYMICHLLPVYLFKIN